MDKNATLPDNVMVNVQFELVLNACNFGLITGIGHEKLIIIIYMKMNNLFN